MRKIINRSALLLVSLLATAFFFAAQAQTSQAKAAAAPEKKTYLIEREIPNAGQLTPAELKSISQKSCGVLKEMGSSIEWVHSYVTGNKIYCIYKAENEELIRTHAKKGGFPANSIVQIGTVISPATAQ